DEPGLRRLVVAAGPSSSRFLRVRVEPRDMSAEKLLKDGDLEGAKRLLQEDVRREPANPKHRIFLFQLLAIDGAWERAITQLDVLADMAASSLAMARVYREAVACEILRREVFQGKKAPLVLGEPDPWIALVIEAMRLTADNNTAQADSLRADAFEQAPAASGS